MKKWHKKQKEKEAMTQGEGGMTTTTTIWRPGVRVSLDENGEVEDTEGEEEEIMKKGTKRKRAPHTKGPCEHGVKYRSNCKVCSACPHGKWRRLCKECGGSGICVHGRRRSLQGVRRGLNLRARPCALSLQGVQEIARLHRDSDDATDADPREARRHDLDTS